MKAIYNSRILPLEEINLEIHNRAFCYGDGLFETIVTGPDRINLTHYHTARLAKACALLHIEIPIDAQMLGKMMKELRKANQVKGNCRFRLQVWRDSGGLYEPLNTSASYLLTCDATTYPFYGSIDCLGVSENARVTYHQLSFAKTMSAMPYVVAGLERKQSAYDDLIITNEKGDLAEAIVSNLFCMKDGKFYTPHSASGCIEGTMRAYLLEKMKDQAEQVNLSIDDLKNADAIFLTNAAGIRWVKEFQGKGHQNPGEHLQPYFTQLLQP